MTATDTTIDIAAAQVIQVARPGAMHGRDLLGEGVLWSARQHALLWVDIIGQRINRLDLASGLVAEWPVPDMIGWVLEREGGPGFIAGLRSGFATITLDPFSCVPIGAPEPDLPRNRMNDAMVCPQGRIWAGTMNMDGETPTGNFYRLDHDLSWTKVDSGYRIANGPVLSADACWLYHTDSALGRVYRFAYAADGSLGPRETFLEFPESWGSPDGMTIDSDGGLWIAHWGAGCISRFAADGTRTHRVALPASQITNLAFAGDNLDRLFVTSAADGVDEPAGGALFEVVGTGFRGCPTPRFGG
ncbi:SMP-30/gluconolactonase/LRE family protein [Novosphingobium sp. SG919]|uniref:SMP-30/gluconolactonase/LRE family protein n=1 Tax=unclassified Novosphingobium TaxID=2644732 RepID=UPI001832873B|nr:sugar lactone lactonase YvrE [Novosphingobium sp. SG919]NMN88864.1 sugar lactone lactonase YvrE [Novosphingobium sp. SG916]